jgi:hypothetical protein
MEACGRTGSVPDLPAAARFFQREKGVDQLAIFIRESFSVYTYTPAQAAVSSVKWRRIYTTNYDDVLETVFQKVGKPLIPVTLSKNAAEFAPQDNVCIHLNGFVRGLTASQLETELKLTTLSYLTETVSNSPWSFLLRSDVRSARAVIFLGYSMYDLDIQRLIHSDEATRAKYHFVIASGADDVEVANLEEFGQVYAIGCDEFAKLLNEKIKSHIPADEEALFLCFDKIEVPATVANARDEDLFDLLLKGDLRPELVWRAMADPAISSYYVVREEIKSVLQSFQTQQADVVLHAEFGNGKTAFLAGLAMEAAAAGLNVYSFVTPSRSLAAEIASLARSKRPTVVIIENYPRLMDQVRQLFLNANKDVRIVLTARSLDHEIYAARLDEMRGSRDLLEFDINKLHPPEEEKLVDLFDTHGLWGDIAADSRQKKLLRIRGRYESEFQKLLLDVLKSPNIIEKIKQLTIGLDQDNEAAEMVTALCVLDIMQVNPSVDLVSEVVDSDLARRSTFQRNPIVRRFIEVDRNKITMRSSILARHLLTEILPADQTVDVLLKMARRSEIAAPVDPMMKDIFRLLQAFSNVQFMLPEKNKRPLLIRYYEQLKNAPGCIGNVFFWLQYAIARLSFQDYKAAGLYFDTAYGLAKGMVGFNTFQIDNHYARYRLEKCIYDNDAKGSFSAFQDAKQILHRQMTREHRYYPYRVARNYFDFYATFFAQWTPAERAIFINECKYVVDRIDKLKSGIRNHYYVVDARRRLTEILSKQS